MNKFNTNKNIQFKHHTISNNLFPSDIVLLKNILKKKNILIKIMELRVTLKDKILNLNI